MKASLNFHFESKKSIFSVFVKYNIGVSVLACILLLAGCGGSSSSSDDTIVQPDSVAGLWFGQVTTVEGESEKVLMAVSPKGKAVMFSEASHNALIARGSLSENTFLSDDTMLYPGTGMTRQGTMLASALQNSIDGSATLSGTVINFSAVRVSSTEDVSLTDIAGNYSSSWNEGLYTRSFAIDIDGIISGSDTNGCLYSGVVEPFNAVDALFDITIKADVCFDDFEYKGLLAYGVFPFEYQNSINHRKGVVIVSEESSGAYAFRQFSPQN